MQFLRKRNAGSFAVGNSAPRARRIGMLVLMLQGLLTLLLVLTSEVSSASAAPLTATRPLAGSHAGQMAPNPEDIRLRQLIRQGRMASTVRVVASLAPTVVEQFPLVPSGLKTAFPNATALVTIVRGNRDNSVSDTVTVDVQHMPPNITFTIFFIQFANKPFGNVEYVADLTTRGDGSGETVFQCIALVAFAMDARNPGTSQDDKEGTTSGTNLEHMGMWFSSLQDAQKVLNNDSLQGTIFDGGNPPLHAGPQAMTDGQTAPVF
jgi:hypothetical protein